MTSTFMGRGNKKIQLVKVMYYKLPTIGKQLSTFPHRVHGLNHRPQRSDAPWSPLYIVTGVFPVVYIVLKVLDNIRHVHYLCKVFYILCGSLYQR